jgi:hypothetical protein
MELKFRYHLKNIDLELETSNFIYLILNVIEITVFLFINRPPTPMNDIIC